MSSLLPNSDNSDQKSHHQHQHQHQYQQSNQAVVNPGPGDRYQILSQLGDTLQGRIYKGRDKSSNRIVAIKETWRALVSLGKCRNGSVISENYLNEISILKYLSSLNNCHPSIIRILSTWCEPLCFMYSMEYCSSSLFNYMKNIHERGHMKLFTETMKKLPQRTMNIRESSINPWIKFIQNIFIQLVGAIQFIHENNIVHLDLSLENLMLLFRNSKQPQLKIIDFGLAKYIQNQNIKLNTRCGKLAYMAPEVFAKQPYNPFKADIWCLGVILFTMVVGAPLYKIPNKSDAVFRAITENKIEYLLTRWKRLRLINDDIIDLLNKIFKYENERININDLVTHPFLNPSRYNDIKVNTTAPASNHVHINTPSNDIDIKSNELPVFNRIDSDDDNDNNINDNDNDCQMRVYHESDDTQDTFDDNDINDMNDVQIFDNNQSFPGIRDFNASYNDKVSIDNNDDNNDNDINNLPQLIQHVSTMNIDDNDHHDASSIPIAVPLPARTSFKEPSNQSSDEYLNPRIGVDGMFEFGLITPCNNTNNSNSKQNKYQF